MSPLIRYIPAKRDGIYWNISGYDLKGQWICPSCDGNGESRFDKGHPCPDCYGTGKISIPHLIVDESDSEWINNFLGLYDSKKFREHGVIVQGFFDILLKKIDDYTRPKLVPARDKDSNVIRLSPRQPGVYQDNPIKPVAAPKSQRLPDKDGIPQIGAAPRKREPHVPAPHLQKQYLDQIKEIINYAKFSPDVDIIVDEI